MKKEKISPRKEKNRVNRNNTDDGWNRGVGPEVYAALIGINVRRWNKCFDQDMRAQFNREKTSF